MTTLYHAYSFISGQLRWCLVSTLSREPSQVGTTWSHGAFSLSVIERDAMFRVWTCSQRHNIHRILQCWLIRPKSERDR